MNNRYRHWVCLLIALSSCHQEKSHRCNFITSFDGQELNLETLIQLEVITGVDSFDFSQKNKILIYFLSDISCNTCVSRDVKIISQIQGDVLPQVQILILAKSDNDYYIQQLRRVGRLTIPVLRYLQNEPDALFNGESMFLEVELESSRVLSGYYPQPNPEFEQCTWEYLERFIQGNAKPVQ